MPDGKTVNLTANLPVKFWNEETDTPSTPGAYGQAGWTKDGKSGAALRPVRHLAGGAGRLRREEHHRRIRPGAQSAIALVRTETDPRDRWIDPSKPLLLQAENLKTWESGFFRGSLEGGEPKQLVMADKSFSRAGEGQGCRRLPADRADLQRVSRPA